VNGIKKGIEKYSKQVDKKSMIDEVHICILDSKTYNKFREAWNNEDGDDVKEKKDKKHISTYLDDLIAPSHSNNDSLYLNYDSLKR